MQTNTKLAVVCPLVVAGLMTMNAYPEPWTVKEDVFLKQPISFTPPGEQALDDQWLVPPAQPYPFPTSHVARVNGVLRMTSEGGPLNSFARLCYATTLTGAPVERQLREHGIRFYVVETQAGAPTSDAIYAEFAHRADNLLAAVPDAQIMVRMWLPNVGDDFVKQHPDALLAGPTGITDWGFSYFSKHNFRPNFLNDWRRYCGEQIYRLAHKIGQSKFAPRVVGFYICAMNSGEWWYYKGQGDPGWDYSPTRKAAFHLFRDLKYGADTNRSDALPTLAERNVWPPQPCSPVSDYNQVLNLPVSNAAKYFARIIKVATGDRCMAGMAIHAGLNCFPGNGTVFLTQLLDCPDIDFLGGPANYNDRGEGHSPEYRDCAASLDRHGKVWFLEGDFRTHRVYGTGHVGDPPPDPQGMIQVLRREFVRAELKQYQTYLLDFGWGWFYDRDVIRTVGELDRLAPFMSKAGLERNAEIAVVSDQESQLYYNYFANPYYLRPYVLDHIGADHDYYELRDFLARDTYRKYKFVIFLNVCALSDPERAAIEKIKRDGRVVLWMHNPGVINLSRRNPDLNADLTALTGIRLEAGHTPQGKLQLTADGARLLGLSKSATTYSGPGEQLHKTVLMEDTSPADCAAGLTAGNVLSDIACVDPDAVILGRDEGGRAAFALRRHRKWTSVYSASCLLRPEIVRRLAQMAGCDLWLDTDDITWQAGKFVAIHATTAGTKEISLPRRTDVFDVFARRQVARRVTKLSLPMQFGETALLYLGPARTAQKSLETLDQQHEADQTRFVAANPSPSVIPVFYQQQSLHRPPPGTGPFPITFLCPAAFLYAGPFPATAEAVLTIDELAGKAADVRRSATEPPLPADVPARRVSSRYLYLDKLQPPRSPTEGFGPWYAGALDCPWVDDYQLGAGENQTYLVSFYLDCQPGKKIELLFKARGEGRIWLNGTEPSGKSGAAGTILELPRKRNLVVIRVTNRGGPSGFTCKILEPNPSLQPGHQATKPAEGVQVWLAPE